MVPRRARGIIEDALGDTRVVLVTGPRQFGRSTVDEVQRVPELLLSIKESVDANPTPGRFLLTGSAHVLSLCSVPDALPGRLETVEL